MEFDAAKRDVKFGCIQCQGNEEKETGIPLQKNSESQSRRQSHPSELSES